MGRGRTPLFVATSCFLNILEVACVGCLNISLQHVAAESLWYMPSRRGILRLAVITSFGENWKILLEPHFYMSRINCQGISECGRITRLGLCGITYVVVFVLSFMLVLIIDAIYVVDSGHWNDLLTDHTIKCFERCRGPYSQDSVWVGPRII